MALLAKSGAVIRQKPMTLFEARQVKELIRPLAIIEQEAIESALILCEGRCLEAARRLGIGKTTLYRKVHQYRTAATARTASPA